MKAFRIYLLHSKVIAYVPSAAIKDILTQPDSDGRRSKWIAKLLEYDIEIQLTKSIKGQGLAKLLAKSAAKNDEVNYILEVSASLQTGIDVSAVNQIEQVDWYRDVCFFLRNLQAPPEMDKSKVRALKLKAVKYCLNNSGLF